MLVCTCRFRTPEERITACFKGFQQMRDEISYKLAKKIEEYDKYTNKCIATADKLMLFIDLFTNLEIMIFAWHQN